MRTARRPGSRNVSRAPTLERLRSLVRRAPGGVIAFAEAFPLSDYRVERSRSSAEALASKAQQVGLQAEVADDPRHAVVGADIVITSVPDGPDLSHFSGRNGYRRAFASLVDLDGVGT